MKNIERRSIGTCIFLSFITCGLYLIYWDYLLVRNVKEVTGDNSSCASEVLCLTFIPLYPVYWWFTRGKMMTEGLKERGISFLGNEFAYLFLSFFGMRFICRAIMQNDFNRIPTRPVSKPSPVTATVQTPITGTVSSNNGYEEPLDLPEL